MAIELNIFGVIGDANGESKDTISNALKMAGGQDVVVNISSSGGSVFDGLSIAAMISSYNGKTTAKGLGIVASAATLIMLSCKEKVMSKNSFFMLHNSWGGSEGNAEEMEKTVELLKKVDEQMAEIYTSQIESKNKMKEGDREKTLKMVKKMMDDETWLTADEALEIGFIDKVVEEDEQMNKLYEDTFAYVRAEANFKNIPKQIKMAADKEKKSLLQQMANWLGLKAEITEEVENIESVTDVNQDEVITEPEAEAEAVTEIDDSKILLESELDELNKKIEQKQKELEEIEANIASKINYKSEAKAEKKNDNSFTQEQILSASKFINSLFKH